MAWLLTELKIRIHVWNLLRQYYDQIRALSSISITMQSLFVSLRFFSFPFFVTGVSHTRYSAFSNFVSFITALIIESLVTRVYLSRYLPSEQSWRADGDAFFTSHFTSRHAWSCLIDTLSRYKSLNSGGLSFSLTITKKGRAQYSRACGEIAETKSMRKVRTATFRAICVGRGSRAKLIRSLTPSMF